MSVTVVVGAQWGDEGKAKVIDLLARENDVVARYQGGHNAGHTVVVGSEKYALQLIPSGVLYSHVTPVIGNGVVVDLPTLFSEIDRLEARGVSCARLMVSSQAHLIFPWHQTLDALSEGSLGADKIVLSCKVSSVQDLIAVYRTLAERCYAPWVDLDAVKGVVTTMIQTEKYGTPLASALRVLSAEFRNERMMRAEEKAAAVVRREQHADFHAAGMVRVVRSQMLPR